MALVKHFWKLTMAWNSIKMIKTFNYVNSVQLVSKLECETKTNLNKAIVELHTKKWGDNSRVVIEYFSHGFCYGSLNIHFSCSQFRRNWNRINNSSLAFFVVVSRLQCTVTLPGQAQKKETDGHGQNSIVNITHFYVNTSWSANTSSINMSYKVHSGFNSLL